MRLPLAGLAALFCLASACRDDRPLKSSLVTAPPQPAITMRNLPKTASTICVANVRQRDQLLAKAQTVATSRTVAALDAVIEDVCQ